MIERIDNSLQIAVLAVCLGAALVRVIRRPDRAQTLLALFYGS